MSTDCKLDIGTENEEYDMWDPNLSIMDKWRNRKKNKKQNKSMNRRITWYMWTTVALHGPIQLFMFIFHIVPALFGHYDDWSQYYLKIIFTHWCIMGYANYFFTVFYSTDVDKSRDRPLTKSKWDTPPETFTSIYNGINGHANGFANGNANDNANGTKYQPEGWTYCDKCQIYIPPRARHCDVCEKCILKRDHHCYVVGVCVGFRNQRYFTVMSFYGVVTGGIMGYFYLKYLLEFYYPQCNSVLDFFGPIAVIRYVLGYAEHMSFHMLIMMFQLIIQLFFAFAGFMYFASQITIITQGITLYELAKKVPVRNTNSINENFKSVFGDFWALNFLFPMQLILRQHDDGCSWEGVYIDDNANIKGS